MRDAQPSGHVSTKSLPEAALLVLPAAAARTRVVATDLFLAVSHMGTGFEPLRLHRGSPGLHPQGGNEGLTVLKELLVPLAQIIQPPLALR